MVFIINKSLVLNFSREFDSRNLELLQQKDAYRYEYLDSFEKFSENKVTPQKMFLRVFERWNNWQ